MERCPALQQTGIKTTRGKTVWCCRKLKLPCDLAISMGPGPTPKDGKQVFKQTLVHHCPPWHDFLHWPELKQSMHPSVDEHINIMCSLHTWEHHSATKREEAPDTANTWMDPENTVLSERSRHRRTLGVDSTDGKSPEQADTQTQRVGLWLSEAGEFLFGNMKTFWQG